MQVVHNRLYQRKAGFKQPQEADHILRGSGFTSSPLYIAKATCQKAEVVSQAVNTPVGLTEQAISQNGLLLQALRSQGILLSFEKPLMAGTKCRNSHRRALKF